MTEQDTSVPAINRTRLECLVDGVFAIAMTLLVLELKVPELVDRVSTAELGRALTDQAAVFRSYLLTFAVLGLFWYWHNRQYEHYRAISRGMLMLHFVQLAAAASFPFCAALLGRYPSNRLSVVIYLGCVLVYVWVSCGTWILARRSESLGAEVTEGAYLGARRRWIVVGLALSVMFTFYLIRVLVG